MKTDSNSYPRLLGDIGGTNARFATLTSPGAPISHELILPCADFPTPLEAIETYLDRTGAPRPKWAAAGIANPVTGDQVKMTNHHWSFSIENLRTSLKLDRLMFLNDFTALALSLPALQADELKQVGGGTAVKHGPIALLGAGTGLGVSGLIPYHNTYIPLEGEGGHVTLAPSNSREDAIVHAVRGHYPHVSAERLLSGPGLVTLYQAIAEIDGMPAEPLTPAQVAERGAAGSCPLCSETLSVFCAMLGTVAADLALTLGARGGVFIGGGIVPKLGEYFHRSAFRPRFEQKGRFTPYLQGIPTYVIHARVPALIGAARALEEIPVTL